MTLESLQQAMYDAMKNHDTVRKDVLSSILSNVKKVAIDKKCKDNITEQLVDEVILKEKKTVQEMIDTCPVDREATLAIYREKLGIIEQYAPNIIDDSDEIRKLIIDCCEDISFSMKNKGLIMKTVSAKYKGKVNMRIVQEVVGTLLN